MDATLLRLRWRIFSVAYDGVADGCKLHPNLVLQSCHKHNSHQGSRPERPLDAIPQLGARGVTVFGRSQLLEHPFTPKVVNKRSFFRIEIAADDSQVFPNRSMREKLPNERIPISLSFCEEQDPGSETINAMDNKGPLPL